MPRPCKARRICAMPGCRRFGPSEPDAGRACVRMTLDEYEAVRLIDLEGLTQEQCAQQMEVARTTVQAIYAAARKKLAQCIVQGCPLHIGGGHVRFCEHHGQCCGSRCRRCGAAGG